MVHLDLLVAHNVAKKADLFNVEDTIGGVEVQLVGSESLKDRPQVLHMFFH